MTFGLRSLEPLTRLGKFSARLYLGKDGKFNHALTGLGEVPRPNNHVRMVIGSGKLGPLHYIFADLVETISLMAQRYQAPSTVINDNTPVLSLCSPILYT